LALRRIGRASVEKPRRGGVHDACAQGLLHQILEWLVEKHAAEGRPAPEVCDDKYWQEWREFHTAASRHDEMQDRKP
jgi:hypothetical protein